MFSVVCWFINERRVQSVAWPLKECLQMSSSLVPMSL